MTNEISDAEISVLHHIQQIQLRPGMWIGSTYNPYHLMQEVLDNSLDELANGYASAVSVTTSNTGYFCIIDNGRGIPIHQVTLPNGKQSDSIIAATTELFSGAKFDNKAYNFSLGLHGVGLVAVNALSTNMTVSVKDKDDATKKHVYYLEAGFFIKKEVIKNDEKWSTKVEFNVNKKFFTTLEIPISVLDRRLSLIASHYPKSFIALNNKRIEPQQMTELVKDFLGIQDDTTPIFSISEKQGVEKVEVYFTYDKDGKQSQTLMGDVNLNICEGMYLSTFATLFYNVVNTYIDNDKITKNDILGQFRAYVSLTVQTLEFDSQTKSRMVKNVSSLINIVKARLVNIITTQKFFKDHFEFLLESKALQTAAKTLKTKKVRVSTDNPLKDCVNIPGKTLYILEGDSAGGTLKQVRDKYNDAIFPLSGKILNAINKSIDKAVESKKVKFLLEAIGVDLTKKNQTDFRYENIKIICDADLDGLHIITLTTVVLWKYATPLINNRKVSMLLPPLYGATKGKQFIPIYNIKNVAQYEQQGYSISRFKGLGEMNPDQLAEVVYKNPVEYIIEPPKDEKESDVIIKCLTDANVKRYICKNPLFGLEKILSTLTN